MNRVEYLHHSNVRAFIGWLTPFVTGELRMQHESGERGAKGRPYGSLYEAYERFSVRSPDDLRRRIRAAVCSNDNEQFLDTAIEVRKWGGINRHVGLKCLGCKALETLSANARRLDPKFADTQNLKGIDYVESGYSKIYSLMLDDFPIYDSRVACALASLVWLYCQEVALGVVPCRIQFGVPDSYMAKVNRNPYALPNISPGEDLKYAKSNLKAAWLLGKLSKLGKFGELPAERRVAALERALFMIGYEPLTQKSILLVDSGSPRCGK